MLLTAADLKPGVRFKYNGHPVEILHGPEKRKDRFGQELNSWWARRIDTGDEGYVSLGPDGVLRVERLKTSPAQHHGTRKKPPAQLQREINEVLARSPSPPKSATVIVYSRPSGYWYAQAHDATTGARITDASGYSREGVLRELRGKFAMIGVTIESITDKDPYQAHATKFVSQADRFVDLQRQGFMKRSPMRTWVVAVEAPSGEPSEATYIEVQGKTEAAALRAAQARKPGRKLTVRYEK